jgi:subtilisin
MANRDPDETPGRTAANRVSSPVEELLLAALERGDESLETGRYLVTFKEAAVDEGIQALSAQGVRAVNARDFTDQAVTLENVGDADAVVFPEIGVALISGDAAQMRGLSVGAEIAADSPIEAIEPERFVFVEQTPTEYLRGVAGAVPSTLSEYLRGFARATETITQDLGVAERPVLELDQDPLVVGATWGLIACKVPPSLRSGAGIRVAVLDTGFDLGHPDFAGRPVVSQTFVGQPVQDLHGHGTHCIGTSCGPKAPAGSTPRYGVAFRAPIFVGKVLTNSGSGTSASVLAGMNWAIANRCVVISMSLGAQPSPVQAAYTAAGRAALNNGLLIVAAAGNNPSVPTGAPANSPTIMAVASLDPNLTPSSFSASGKIEIAAPGRDVFSSWIRPLRYRTISGTSMATPHVAGCAALWAESSAALRGQNLWNRLQTAARRLPFLPTRVGAGLVQAP